MAKLIHLLGKRFGRLLVVGGPHREDRKSHYKWLCQCDCGKTKLLVGHDLRRGHVVSCGCFSREAASIRNATHGLLKKHMATYNVWRGMKRRCYDPNNIAYQNYGQRGISVCARWRNDFAAFFKDMGAKPKGMHIDRIDNSRGYEPGNCRWTTPKQNNRNRRSNRLLTINGVTKPMVDWAEQAGFVSGDTVGDRLARGWSAEDAVFTPRMAGAW